MERLCQHCTNNDNGTCGNPRSPMYQKNIDKLQTCSEWSDNIADKEFPIMQIIVTSHRDSQGTEVLSTAINVRHEIVASLSANAKQQLPGLMQAFAQDVTADINGWYGGMTGIMNL